MSTILRVQPQILIPNKQEIGVCSYVFGVKGERINRNTMECVKQKFEGYLFLSYKDEVFREPYERTPIDNPLNRKPARIYLV